MFEKPVLFTLAQHVVYALLAQIGPGELARLSALLDDDATPGDPPGRGYLGPSGPASPPADTTLTGPAGPFTATLVFAP